LGDAIVVVGAGLSGLACARALVDAGREVRVLERARGVGGRCATRMIEGQPIDHGPAFLHGSDPRFLSAIRGAAGKLQPGWPTRIEGEGAPCHPASLREDEQRFVFAEGLNALPRSLASGLPIELERTIAKIDREEKEFVLTLADGSVIRARQLILSTALEQTAALLKPLSVILKPLRGTLALLESMASLPCIALLAAYEKGRANVPWELFYPADSKLLQLASFDSCKRLEPRLDAFVFQARPRWSREHLVDGDESWTRAILEEAARLFGPWALAPKLARAQRWTYSRTQSGTELTAPILHRFGDGFLGLSGDAFAFGGGAQGAFLSGVQLAKRILR